MITLFSNTLVKSKEFGKIEFKCPEQLLRVSPIKISISCVTERDRDCWATTNIDIVNVLIGEESQFYYNDGKENQEHRANAVFFKDIDVDDWNNIYKDESLIIEMYNYSLSDVRVNVCLWCEE